MMTPRLSSLGNLKCITAIGRMHLGPQVLSFVERPLVHCPYLGESSIPTECTANTSSHVIQIVTITDEIIKGKEMSIGSQFH
jgi:hypothetical protein